MVQDYLYSCINPKITLSYGSTSYAYDMIFTKHDPTTGNKIYRTEIG